MTILGNEDHALYAALQQSEKSNNLIKLTGKASILAGLLLIGLGLQPAETPSAQAQPEQDEGVSSLAVSGPIKIDTTFKSEPVNGRIDDVSLLTTDQTDEQRAPDEEDVLLKSEQSAFTTLQPAVGDADAEIDADVDNKAIWLAIHQPEYELEWLDETFTISHYTYALERDPIYAEDELITVPGLPGGDLYKAGFIYGGRGILQQGTGYAENGRYITIDWDKSYHDPEDVSKNRWFFKYGIGRPVVPWKTVATHHPDLPQGTQIIIETYYGEHRFIVGDGGLDLATAQIDVFVGNMTIAEADELGVTWSRVGIVRPINYLLPNQTADVFDDSQMETYAD